ncbi:oxidoreductase [Nocardiopsis sp. N85]|uniref:oxidoreductase n=1 Tax=Nocardiopsis sp. N85 TaxID=3029400 RepID=UPI00237F9398|nr:oxidoreductase [Nocardiopsis sp. N85]MDE3724543.1 oxidoreductase [Nocardiopsis sp. N85]
MLERVSETTSAAQTDPLARIAALPGVAEAVEETRTLVDRLLGHRILRRRSSDVSMESSLRGACASAALEGAEVSMDEIRAGHVYDTRIKGALRVGGELGTLVETWPKAPRQVLARLHTLAAADAVSADALGRPRLAGERVEDPLGVGAPLSPEAAHARMEGLYALLAARTSVPALVTSAVVHGELMAIRPFGWGDGIVARAAERLTLVERGLDPKSLVPSELGHRTLSEEYAPALRGYMGGTPEGVAAWVAYCCRAVRAGAQDSLATCEALKRG